MEIFGAFTGELFRWVIRNSWQASILALVIVVVQLLFRKKLSPGWRYGLWLVLVVRLLMPVQPPSPVSIFNVAKLPATLAVENTFSTEEATSEGEVAEDVSGDGPAPVPSFMEAIHAPVKPTRGLSAFDAWLTFWLSGIAVFVIRLLVENVRFRRRLRDFVPIQQPEILRELQDCAASLGIRHCPLLIETEEVESPAVWGLWRKWLLVPDGTFENFSTAELRHIFLHELAHIKRRDLEIGWVVALLQILYWFNPIVWFAFARMRADRELATDAMALAPVRKVSPSAYGETILKIVEGLNRAVPLPSLVGIAESKASIKERLVAISQSQSFTPCRWAA